MSRFAEFMDWVLVRLGSKPARIDAEATEPAIESEIDSVAGSSAVAPDDASDFFLNELAQFDEGDSKLFAQYRERNEKR